MLRYDLFYNLDFNRVFHYFPDTTDVSSGKKWGQAAEWVADRRVRIFPPKSPGYIWCAPALWSEKRPCSRCQGDGARREPETIRGGSVNLIGGDELGDFLPSQDEVVISKHFLKKLKQTPFRGYSAIPLELECNATDYPALDSEGVYCLLFHGNIHDLDRRKRIARNPNMRCPECHWGPMICPECLGVTFRCPRCGSSLELYNFPPDLDICRPYENTQWIQESYFNPVDRYEALKLEQTVFQAQYWDGNDFITGFPSSAYYITGRVARWIEENQSGPAFLIPVPTDISGCTASQRELLEQICYSRNSHGTRHFEP